MMPDAARNPDALGAAAVNRAAAFVLVAVGAVALYGAVEMRPFFADAPHYLHNMLRVEDYALSAPARRAVEWLRQTPALLAVRIGETDLGTIRALFSLGAAMAPFVLMAACWLALPAGRKSFFVFPLLHFCAGSLASMSATFPEGATAAAAFWALLYFILFRTRGTRSVDLAVLLSVPAVVLNEAVLFLGPLLAIAAWWRAREQETRANRVVMKLLSGWFLVAAAVQIDFIANPRHAGHGAGYLGDLLSGAWIVGDDGTFNLSAALGVAVLAIAGVTAAYAIVVREPGRWFGRALVGAFALVAAAALAYFWFADKMLDVPQQFRARNNALLASFPLAVAALVSLKRPSLVSVAVVRQAAMLCAILGAVAVVWQWNAVAQWSRALTTFRAILADTRGFVEWDAAVARLPADKQRLMRTMIFDWVVSPMSLVFAPGGQVRGMLGTTTPHGFRPFDPVDSARLPESRFWNLAPYRVTLRDRAPPDPRR